MPEMVRSISRERLSKRWGMISAAKLNEITHRVHLLTRST
jgi:mRNA-degrading endonuclease toxin of MazEF toxin-antitoxin module